MRNNGRQMKRLGASAVRLQALGFSPLGWRGSIFSPSSHRAPALGFNWTGVTGHHGGQETRSRLREMEEELKYAPVSFRNQMMNRIQTYKRDLAMFQREIKSTDLGVGPGSRGDTKYGIYSMENEQSTRLQSQRGLLLQGTESLNRATQSIDRSHRIAAETDQIGTEIIEELGDQREQLERTKSRLVNTSENLSKTRKILRSMSKRVMTNKLLLSVIIILELAILGGVVYYKFFRKS
ncbi:vesicle transport through interaction with t-SNAREs homolog 1B isoform X1 [Gopherus flavomarginatus]|uniref:vesicle transport through interaction with t-SNAREs homolog 1B isoform X1 n=1 Tax=Gopherus flavomarginatus TaxID=286002 RepID=UPI0021CC1531|nr:vesicle transport through interaction with t-SNAREs homolog 1B isoform X1 [Gopherus flavomarginatus]XP_050809579.1 vesicle transport through interaction with t-SNAREs homolog 1B isoform X1 [Gopherus flavomarginatus]